MAAELIDGKAVAARVRERVAGEARDLAARLGRQPRLATVLVGEDPASQIYVANKQKAAREVGIEPIDLRLPAAVGEQGVARELERLAADPTVDGILLQLPLPAGMEAERLLGLIPPAKDVDGLTVTNAGLLAQGRPQLAPCTPLGVMELLASISFDPAGKEAVVVGRSNLLGRPMAALLLNANATVTVCHSRTRALAEVVKRAELLVVGVGVPRLVKGGWIRPGAVVIDVGINRIHPAEAGNKSGLVGDVEFEEAAAVAAAITPVPGGVGPMTVAMLLHNTIRAASLRLG